jgi:hypothetical protein
MSNKTLTFHEVGWRMRQVPPPAKPLVTILGMHRSGTSLCANLLHALGIDMADSAGPSPNNKKGHWERPRINDLNDQIFARFSRAWSDPAHILALPEGWTTDPRVQAIKAELIAHITQITAGPKPAGFKDPRTARLMPLWRDIFEAAHITPRIIFCIRDPAQVARSITARDRMAREQAEYRWLLYNAEAVASIGADEICLVPYEQWFERPGETAQRIAAFLGVPPLPPQLVAAIVDPDLRHDDPSLPPARPLARRLHQLIVRGIINDNGRDMLDPDVRAFCTCIGEFEQQVQPLLVDREILRASVADQNRVIGDLNSLIRDLRRATVPA